MRKVFSVFRSDWRRLTASVVTVVVIIGLCLVPCLYAWFNIFSNWDPYGTSATSNIHIAVASEDEGRDILGVKLNIGDMVIDALHSNDQMGWQFLRCVLIKRGKAALRRGGLQQPAGRGSPHGHVERTDMTRDDIQTRVHEVLASRPVVRCPRTCRASASNSPPASPSRSIAAG